MVDDGMQPTSWDAYDGMVIDPPTGVLDLTGCQNDDLTLYCQSTDFSDVLKSLATDLDEDMNSPSENGSVALRNDATLSQVGTDNSSISDINLRLPQEANQIRRLEPRVLNVDRPTTVLPPLTHTSTRLVEHYFSTVCGLYSCFDSSLNPFRYLVDQLWSHSGSTYFAIQSMAAAHLGNEMIHMRKEGARLHRTAFGLLQQEMHESRSNCLEDLKPLMSLLLLGLSASWQRASDLGLAYLDMARGLARSKSSSKYEIQRDSNDSLFGLFKEAMVYWELMISFVTDQSSVNSTELEHDMMQLEHEAPSPILNMSLFPFEAQNLVRAPHPWTGVSPQPQKLLAEVGKLVRHSRIRNIPTGVEERASDLAKAFDLEAKLLRSTPPSSESITCSGDAETQQRDFIVLAEATRDCGLLELYRIFPEVLQRRMHTDAAVGFEFFGNPPPAPDPTAWLTASAIRILRNLESIPNTSRVRAHQLLLLLIAAAELRFSQHTDTDTSNFDQDMQVHWARRFARARLLALSVQLPAQPVLAMIELLAETWRRMDTPAAGQRQRQRWRRESVFWMDVMVEKGLHTIMG